MSPPPLYEVEVVLRTTTGDDGIVVSNENGDGSDEEDDVDDATDDEDLDPSWLPDKEKKFLITIYCLNIKMTGTIHLALPTAK